MYIFIFREGVFLRICIILAGTQRGGEKVSLCPILSAILKWGGGRRVFLQPISHLSCVYPCRDGQGPETHFTLTASTVRACCTHTVLHAAPAALSHRLHVFPRGRRTMFLLLFSSQIVSISLQEHVWLKHRYILLSKLIHNQSS